MQYRVKLTPGTLKKGKAAKLAVELFTTGKDCIDTEKSLIRGMLDPEMVAILLGYVKLSMPGSTQLKNLISYPFLIFEQHRALAY